LSCEKCKSFKKWLETEIQNQKELSMTMGDPDQILKTSLFVLGKVLDKLNEI